MAINIKLQLENGIELEKGYFRITGVNLNSDTNEVHFTGALYASKEAREEGLPTVEQCFYSNSFITTDKTGNLIEQAYMYIKELALTYDREKELFAEGKAI